MAITVPSKALILWVQVLLWYSPRPYNTVFCMTITVWSAVVSPTVKLGCDCWPPLTMALCAFKMDSEQHTLDKPLLWSSDLPTCLSSRLFLHSWQTWPWFHWFNTHCSAQWNSIEASYVPGYQSINFNNFKNAQPIRSKIQWASLSKLCLGGLQKSKGVFFLSKDDLPIGADCPGMWIVRWEGIGEVIVLWSRSNCWFHAKHCLYL